MYLGPLTALDATGHLFHDGNPTPRPTPVATYVSG
jgi:hypothetical protein